MMMCPQPSNEMHAPAELPAVLQSLGASTTRPVDLASHVKRPRAPGPGEQARQLWGADRVEEVLSCWLAQFHSLFGPPLAELAEAGFRVWV